MDLIADYIHTTPHGGLCNISIYAHDPEVLPVVLCTEPRDNPGMSITNCAEQLAAEVMDNHPHLFDSGLGDKPFAWIEHYEDGARGTPQDRATFDLVEFSSYEPRDVMRAGVWTKEIGSPSWKPSSRSEAEAMIGGRVRL
jgi:hypothetical protein